jgi:hypothetical protein
MAGKNLRKPGEAREGYSVEQPLHTQSGGKVESALQKYAFPRPKTTLPIPIPNYTSDVQNEPTSSAQCTSHANGPASGGRCKGRKPPAAPTS